MRKLKIAVLAGVAILVVLAVTMPVWKPVAKRFKWFVVATNVYQDTLRRTGMRVDQISQPDYGAIPDSEVQRYLDRINSTFADYERYGQLDASRLRGRRVLEIGPGETLGVALRFIGAGAEQVTAVDKFVPLQQSSFHQRLYSALAAGLPPDEHERVSAAVDLSGGVRLKEDRLAYVYGEGVEDTAVRLPGSSFDVIVSNAVLEEVYDLDQLFASLDHLLKPGGRQVHVIDLGDYGMFAKHGFHPLEFLTIPDGIYRYMVEASGQPNRKPLQYYRDKAAALGYRAQIYRTWVVGNPSRLPEYRTAIEYGRDYSDENVRLVHGIRGRLLPRYRNLPDDELMTRSILFVADKPEAPTTRASRD